MFLLALLTTAKKITYPNLCQPSSACCGWLLVMSSWLTTLHLHLAAKEATDSHNTARTPHHPSGPLIPFRSNTRLVCKSTCSPYRST
ncbi:hypothetical protein BO94DRAFT_163154 [Aspergillus sclerotioniger CBS 115572]|uniref:Uncharacterized protein n=1 Tax=Aspergillus sclerotioniger CBS 115572 TaxID=1450535 RepID=A0A317W376_9EURO|nr:hypothetical protein BO94DRAFT_163154 [Aspergillus sclerotioniger CBS 115572]PWY80465.1 hypothetical protein BO94DRAFT_163154 [Aspergillus sclerotioniger CBS 115572]